MFDKFYGIPQGVFGGWHPHLKFALSHYDKDIPAPASFIITKGE